ncbi:flagellar basal body rod protein FlgB [Planctomicrobium sp. SH664]|uniref:flagellar basal body rod protein FlgB n=1 Tax=Planctomicrobium sp. SH664 TaxID=3448125 RepID=UPI003F5C214A
MFGVSPQLGALAKLMDVADLRHHVISQNLANVNTPGYQRLDIDFEKEFSKAIQKGGVEATAGLKPRVIEEAGLAARTDGNNVDVDREIGELNRNALQFQTYSQLLSSQFDLMRRATRST